MMIQPPVDKEEDEPGSYIITTSKPNEWYVWFFDVPNWKCNCGLMNFGRNKYCADTRCRTPRPADFNEGESWKEL